MSARKMKDSGIEWIGEIPEEWKVCKIKHLSAMKSGESITSSEIAEAGQYPVYGGNGLRGYTSAYTNDGKYILIGRQGALCGNVRSVEGKFWATEHAVVVYEYDNVDVNWFKYSLDAMNLNQYSTSAAQPGLSVEQITNILACVPPFAEQKAIAAYLDEKCAAIDKIVVSKQKQNEQLAEYRQSLITEAVTKGLNSSAPMKNSGIEWIGEIPKTWEIIQLKYLFSMYAGGDVDANDFSTDRTDKFKYPIYSNSLDNEGLFGYMSYYRFCGETITVTGRGDVGKAIARNNAFYPIVRLLVCVPKLVVDVRYFTYCINSADLFGDQTAMAQLTTQKLSAVKVPVPKYTEQKEIAAYLDKKCGEIDALSERNKNIIESLQEYKQSLIYEAVTGKIEL